MLMESLRESWDPKKLKLKVIDVVRNHFSCWAKMCTPSENGCMIRTVDWGYEKHLFQSISDLFDSGDWDYVRPFKKS